MAYLNLDGDIFSPIRVDSSLADSSINSGGSISSAFNFDLGLLSKDSPTNKCVFEFSDANTDEAKQELGSNYDGHRSSMKSKKSDSILTISKDSLTDSANSKKLSANLEALSQDKKILTKDKNISAKENSVEILKSQHKGRKSQQKEITGGSSEQSHMREKKPVRPTTLLPSENKVSESSGGNDSKKRENVKGKFTSSKNRDKDKVQKRNSAESSEKDSLKNKNVLDVRKVNALKPGDFSEKQPLIKNKVVNDFENSRAKELTQHSGDTRLNSKPLLQTEQEVIEKIARDHISFECDKIRQNIYSQQMSFYRQINKTKEELEKQHSQSAERLFKVMEQLMQINAFLKEN